jgi:hypothetical protein
MDTSPRNLEEEISRVFKENLTKKKKKNVGKGKYTPGVF